MDTSNEKVQSLPWDSSAQQRLREKPLTENLQQVSRGSAVTEYSLTHIFHGSMVTKDKSKEATASGATDAPQYRAAARNRRRPEDKKFIRMATLNVGTLSGRSAEVVDFMKRRKCRIVCVQETKWKSDRARMVGDGFKLIHAGGDGKSDGVGVILDSDLVEKVCRTVRWNGRILMVWLAIGARKLCVMSVYAPQVGRSQREKRIQGEGRSTAAVSGRRRNFVSGR